MPRRNKDAEQFAFDFAAWNEIVSNLTTPAFTGWVERSIEGSGGDVYELLVSGGMLNDDAARIVGSFNVQNPKVQEWLRGYSMTFARKINTTMAETLKESLAEGIRLGETGGELKQRVLDVMGPDASKKRAAMIARTESHRAAEHGRLEFWKSMNDEVILAGEQPIYVGKVWRMSPGACAYCAEMDGKQVGLTETFFAKGDSMTLDGVGTLKFNYEDVDVALLHPNCRCVLESVISEAWTN